LEDAEEAQEQPVAQRQDADVDEVADVIKKAVVI